MIFLDVKYIKASQDKILTGDIVPGQIIFTDDSNRIYWDVAPDKRVLMSGVAAFGDDAEREGLSDPDEGLYYVKDTGEVWAFFDGEWFFVIRDLRDPMQFKYVSDDGEFRYGFRITNDGWLQVVYEGDGLDEGINEFYRHLHSNFDVLNLFGEDGGRPMFDGEPLAFLSEVGSGPGGSSGDDWYRFEVNPSGGLRFVYEVS